MKNLSSLSLRLISSAILIPVVIAAIVMGGWIFAAFVFIAMAIAYYEWLHLSYDWRIRLAGIAYVLLAAICLIELRMSANGDIFTILFFLTIWASDSVAYLFGKCLGGPKMAPTVSPNKTWAGYAGALIGPCLVLLVGMYVISPSFFALHGVTAIVIMLAGGVAIGVAGQSGDLLISLMKRKVGLKDTGNLIPGHGGILDRIDAMVMASPVFLGFLKMVMTW